MSISASSQPAARPRWDGSCILFEAQVAGNLVACAISRAALQEVSGCHYIKADDLLRRFAEGRDKIEQIAAEMLAVRPESVTGTLHIWADDITDPPSAPAVARQAAGVRV